VFCQGFPVKYLGVVFGFLINMPHNVVMCLDSVDCRESVLFFLSARNWTCRCNLPNYRYIMSMGEAVCIVTCNGHSYVIARKLQ
jgi:hypothetical protein